MGDNGFDLDNECVASTIMDFDLMMPFSMAMETVLPIRRFNKSVSFNRSFLNLVRELGFITSSSGVISKKYLKDMSKWERSTTSTSETSYIVFSNRYLNIRIELSGLRPLLSLIHISEPTRRTPI